MSILTLPAASDNSITPAGRGPNPPRLLHPRWMDVAFEWVARFFAFLVFSLLAAILISRRSGAR
jgi:hypothetical protein